MKNTVLRTATLGYPRIGAHRELKRATEAHWAGKLSHSELEATARHLRRDHWRTQQLAGIDLIPSNDFSFYDQILDTTCLVGNVPPRFHWKGGEVDLETRFAIARGVRGHAHASDDHSGCPSCGGATFASEMTKWFDTNYHYIVPEFQADTRFVLSSRKPFDEFTEALALGIETVPVLTGPVTYLALGKVHDDAHPDFDRFSLLERLLPVYIETLRTLADLGARCVRLDEPVFALDLTPAQRAALTATYATLTAAVPRLKLWVASYFGPLRDNLETYCSLPVHALHFDAVRAPEELDAVLAKLPREKTLTLGVVDGRNLWKNNYTRSLRALEKARDILGDERLVIATSCSLQHAPVSLRQETRLDADLRNWMAFAEEKLTEVATLRALLERDPAAAAALAANVAAQTARATSPRIHRADVAARLGAVQSADYDRGSPFALRQAKQRARLRLPAFPTTTIGSFPQTEAVRAARAQWKKGTLTDAAYEAFLENETAACVKFQEEIGLDMLVHGEFERNDMVEYFGEQLDGFAFTQNGWVQSYGSRYVKPPIIYGDVARPRPMTVRWSRYAQSLTARCMKGMLTGPVTVLQWSFVRDDQPRATTAFQIALALRDEVRDLEAAGIAAIQIDEPALREGLPLRRSDGPAYLTWAVDAFRLTAAVVRDDTQIHTHMCYAEFNDIIAAIARLDADVITIETSRSNMELLQAFVDFRYPNEIGPGVYDIHSPRVPSVEEMEALLIKAAAVLPVENLWVNPDCGLKTRGWAEVKPSLIHMVACARNLRQRFANPPIALLGSSV
jgi:5-methyltetrahydropteroyltriglutamate--homocysteine methyltransferase